MFFCKTGKYLLIKASDIPVNKDDLLRIAIHIGVDFAPGTRGIGPKTAYAKRSREFTDRQKLAYAYMQNDIDLTAVQSTFSRADLESLYKWLEELDFNVEAKRKQIQKLY